MGKHNHKHNHCMHEDNLKYCDACKVVYCTACGKEWREYNNWWTANVTYPTPVWVEGVGNTSGDPIPESPISICSHH